MQQPARRPQVVAHRGASAVEPEHTAAAYLEAIAAGADALECDVRLTADGHLVCVHDGDVARTSDGRGRVSALSLAELEELDWGSWHRPAPGTQARRAPTAGERTGLLTLRALLSIVAGAGRRVEVAVETKHPARHGGLVERRLVELLEEFGWARDPQGPVRVMSFSALALARTRLLAPALPLVLLLDRLPVARLPLRDGALPPGVDTAGPSVALLRRSPGYARRLRERGHRLHVWTVDTPADLEVCLDAGAEAVITNDPAGVLALLRRAVP